MVCTNDGTMVAASEAGAISGAILLRQMHPESGSSELRLLHRFEVGGTGGVGFRGGGSGGSGGDGASRVTAFSLSAENHHAFAADSRGGLLIFANPLVNIQVLERLAGELLNL
tara:strand:+ start:86 stop:424 length:339 start_codon:yes stop_codon:yes gene_type:complete